MTPVTHSFIAYTRGAGAVPGRGRLLGVPASAHPPRRRRETSLAVRLLALQGLMVGAVVLTLVGYGALALQTMIFATPLNLADGHIEAWRSAFEAGDSLHMVPVAWTSAWLSALGLLVTWAGVTWLAARSVGLDSPRPPTPTLEYGPEPVRDARKALAGWPTVSSADQDATPAGR